jgi:hypothetical protein
VAVDDVPRRAGILHDLGRYEEAERLLGQVLSEEPDNVDGLNTLSRWLSSSGRHEGIAGVDAPVPRNRHLQRIPTAPAAPVGETVL